jgi:16S rRNA (cytosine967-C5)-methyltransferase
LLPEYEADLSTVDRGLCHELVLGMLRRQITLDRLIDELVHHRTLDVEIRIILRLGLFQLISLERVPAYAVVNDSVALARSAKKSSASGLVNAVLRNATRALPELNFSDDLDRISVETSHPRWLIQKWADEFGIDTAIEIAGANNRPPSTAFRRTYKSRDLKINEKYRPSEFVDGCFIADSFDPNLRHLADAGDIYFQDEASQLVAASVKLEAGESFLDVCAAPGGKTTAIVGEALLRNPDKQIALFVAGDITDRRVRLLHETCVKQGLSNMQIVQYDASADLPFAERSFDCGLVDAPCTGTGTIRHNPEIRYFIKPSDFERMQRIQIAILTNAARVVRPGGRLIYSTCSLEREENESVCRQFLAATTNFRAVKPNVPDRFLTSDGFARTYPHRDAADGFFIAELIRKV